MTRVRQCDEHPDCTVTLKGKGVVEHSRSHEPKDVPVMPEDPVFIDAEVLAAFADMIRTLENLGKRVKAMEPRVQQTAEKLAAERVMTDARFAAYFSHQNRTDEAGDLVKHLADSHTASLAALEQAQEQLAQRHEAVLGAVTTLRAEFKELKATVSSAMGEVARAVRAGEQAEKDTALYKATRDKLEKLDKRIEHERAERVQATRKFQRSMRSVSDTIAES